MVLLFSVREKLDMLSDLSCLLDVMLQPALAVLLVLWKR